MEHLLKFLHILFVVAEVLVIFNLIIIVHELGHFLAARWRGLVIEGFGVWFGKPLWQKKINGVVYSLGSIPAGGFVKLPQMAPMEAIEGKSETPHAPMKTVGALDKIIVAFAGPLFSFGLAAVFAVIVFAIGRPVGEAEATTTVGYVMEGSPAEKAGIKAGDQILEVDGKPVTRWAGMGKDSIVWRIIRSEGDTIPIKLKRGDEILTKEATPEKPDSSVFERKSLRQIEIMPASTPMIARITPGSAADKAGLKRDDLVTEVNGTKLLSVLDIDEYAKNHPNDSLTLTVVRGGQTLHIPFNVPGAKVAEVSENGPAQIAGLKRGDMVTAIDGKEVPNFEWATDFIRNHKGAPLTLDVLRGDEKVKIQVTPVVPVSGSTDPKIGVAWDRNDGIVWDDMGLFKIIHPRPGEQLRTGVMSIVDTLGALFSKKSDVKLQHLSGPVMIGRLYYHMFQSKEGWRMALWFSVVFNVNLALLNMLPVPVLDGGHITLALVEAVRRKPVNIKILEIVQTACAVLLIGFMIYIAFFDLSDLFGLRGKSGEIKFAKPETQQR
jgi:regulator of sigma E protease